MLRKRRNHNYHFDLHSHISCSKDWAQPWESKHTAESFVSLKCTYFAITVIWKEMGEIMWRLQIPGFGRIPGMVPTIPAASRSGPVPILSPLSISKVKQNTGNVDYHRQHSHTAWSSAKKHIEWLFRNSFWDKASLK